MSDSEVNVLQYDGLSLNCYDPLLAPTTTIEQMKIELEQTLIIKIQELENGINFNNGFIQDICILLKQLKEINQKREEINNLYALRNALEADQQK